MPTLQLGAAARVLRQRRCWAVPLSIHSSPHCAHTCAFTFRTTTTPVPKSTLQVVVPEVLCPPQSGQRFSPSDCFIAFFSHMRQVVQNPVKCQEGCCIPVQKLYFARQCLGNSSCACIPLLSTLRIRIKRLTSLLRLALIFSILRGKFSRLTGIIT